jgi:MFS family permease
MPPDITRNAHRFIIFTVFFNARAYYPILAILFLDLGLTLDQFVFLNLIWAATIFIFEVPSGALADTIGRRRLLIAASVLMIIEMLCLLLAPRNGGSTLLLLCIINRICSGLSEACASGADEALAYDSLDKEDRTTAWDKLLASAMRWRSIGFVVAMIIGGLLYDPHIINFLLPVNWQLSAATVHRLPVALVLCQAFVCLIFTLRMIEPIHVAKGQTIKHALGLTLATARWVFNHPKTLVVILIGVAIDSVIRNFATINSSYYRLIHLPEWTYGFIGAALGVVGIFVPAIAKKLNEKFTMLANLLFVALATFAGLLLLVPAWPIYGVIPVIILMTLMSFLSFTISRVLHQEAESSRRATVLSVKGLIFNLGYGLFSLGFSYLLASYTTQQGNALPKALAWQVPYFMVLVILLFIWAYFHLRPKN